MFLSTYTNKLDRKGRVSVPAAFRTTLSKQGFDGVVAFRSYRGEAIECCGMAFMERLTEQIDDMDMFSDAQDDLATIIFADSHQLPWDETGRILLPRPLIEHAGLEENAAFVGKGKTFQIWNPTVFQERQQQARQRARSEGRVVPGAGRRGPNTEEPS